MTWDNLIALALRTSGALGIGQTANAQDTADAKTCLNSMLSTWQVKRWLVPGLSDVWIASTGAQSYSVGVGADFDIIRPDRIEKAFARQNYGAMPYTLDWTVQSIEAHEDYADIGLKMLGYSQNGVPGYVFYDSSYPLARVYFWPVPSTRYELHLLVKASIIPVPADTTVEIEIPVEYDRALIYGLASDMVALMGLKPRPDIEAKARGALAAVRGANLQVPLLRLPPGLAGYSGYGGFGHRPWAGGPTGGTGIDPADLPTTLPGGPGIYWNNGGVVSVS